MNIKTPKFWQRRNILAYILLPFSFIYLLGKTLRSLFTMPYEPSKLVICVGNIIAGGAGKTPTVIALAEFLSSKGLRPVILSRGYKGKSEGPIEVKEHHLLEDVGDEALLIRQYFPIWIGKDKRKLVQAVENNINYDVIILDDGLQNNTIYKHISFAVIDNLIGMGNEFLLPAGPLRSKISSLNKLDGIILINSGGGYIPAHPNIIKAQITYTPIAANQNLIAFTGIAYPEKFFHTLQKSNLAIVACHSFPDHYHFQARDLDHLIREAKRYNAQLITTEKDYMRIKKEYRAYINYFPIKLEFLETGKLLDIIASYQAATVSQNKQLTTEMF